MPSLEEAIFAIQSQGIPVNPPAPAPVPPEIQFTAPQTDPEGAMILQAMDPAAGVAASQQLGPTQQNFGVNTVPESARARVPLTPQEQLRQFQEGTGGPIDLRIALGGARSKSKRERLLREWSVLTDREWRYNPSRRGKSEIQIQAEHPDWGLEWINLDEDTLALGDLADVATRMPEVAASLITAMALAGPASAYGLGTAGLRMLGTKEVARQALLFNSKTALAGQAAGTAADFLIAPPETMQEIEEVAFNRTMELGLETALGGLIDNTIFRAKMGGSKAKEAAARQLQERLGKEIARERPRTEIQEYIERQAQVLIDAAERNTGEKFDALDFMSLGALTQIPIVQRGEMLSAKFPLNPSKAEMVKKEQGMRAITRAVFGPKTDANQSGRVVVDTLQSLHDAALDSAEVLAQKAMTQAREKLYPELADSLGNKVKDGLFIQATRDAVAGKTGSKWAEHQAVVKQMYDAIRQHPGGSDPIVALRHMKTVAKQMDDKFGENLDPGMQSFIAEILQREGDFTLDEAIQLRARIWRDMSHQDGVRMFDIARHKDLSRAVSAAIDNAPNRVKDRHLKKMLRDASGYYKRNVVPFGEKGIAQLFRKVDEPGYRNNKELLDRWLSQPDELARVRTILGPESSQWGQFRRGVLEHLVENTKVVGRDADLMDSKRLLAKLQSMRDNGTLEVVFGNQANEIIKLADFVSKTTRKIEVGDLAGMTGTPADILQRMAVKQRQADKLYEDSIVGKFISSGGKEAELEPQQFFRWALNTGDAPKVTKAMRLLRTANPEAADEVGRAVRWEILEQASREFNAADIIDGLMGGTGSRLDANSLWHSMIRKYGTDEATSTAKLTALIGEDGLTELKALTIIAAAQRVQQEGFAIAGAFGGGNAQINLMKGILAPVSKQARKEFKRGGNVSLKIGLLSLLLTNPKAQRAIREGSKITFSDIGDDTLKMVGKAVGTTPGVKRVAQTGKRLAKGLSKVHPLAIAARGAASPVVRGPSLQFFVNQDWFQRDMEKVFDPGTIDFIEENADAIEGRGVELEEMIRKIQQQELQ